MYRPEGIIPAIVTPMDERGEINLTELKNQVERQIRAGVHALFPLGTNGEFYALEQNEKTAVIDAAAEANAGRLPLIVGTGCVTTRETVRLSQYAQSAGADAVSVITPYFGAAGDEELYGHYAAVAGAVDIPVILYNIPARTGNSVSPALAKRLSAHNNIVGVKDSSGNFDLIMRYLEQAEGDFRVISGNDSLILSALQLGGAGAISGIANILPEVMVSIYELWRERRFEEAKRVQFSIRPLRNCLAMANPNSVVKLAMNLIGQPVGQARAPFSCGGEKLEAALRAALTPFTA